MLYNSRQFPLQAYILSEDSVPKNQYYLICNICGAKVVSAYQKYVKIDLNWVLPSKISVWILILFLLTLARTVQQQLAHHFHRP